MDLVLTRLKLFLVCSFCLLIFSFSFVLQFGQLGHGTVDNCDWPMVVDDLRGFGATDVACGTKHSVVVSVTGETVSFGFGGNGRLGNGNVQGTLIPYPVTFQDQVRWLLFFGAARESAGVVDCYVVDRFVVDDWLRSTGRIGITTIRRGIRRNDVCHVE